MTKGNKVEVLLGLEVEFILCECLFKLKAHFNLPILHTAEDSITKRRGHSEMIAPLTD